jgi:hypothetical protein
MAAPAFVKFNVFARDCLNGAHRLSTDTVKVMLSNTAPVATNAVKADITEITAQNGYSAGGIALTGVAVSNPSGTIGKLAAAAATLTAAGGSFGPWRYAIAFNDTQATPAKPLIGYWDYGSSVTTNDGEQVIITPDQTNGILQIA